MKDLSDIVSKQQKLLDETFEAKREQSCQRRRRRRVRGEPARPADGVRPRHDHGALFEHARARRQQGGVEGRGRNPAVRARRDRSGQLELGQQPQGQRPDSIAQLGERQQGIARQAAKPDRPLPHRRRRRAGRVPGRGGSHGRRQGGHRREQSRPRHASSRAWRSIACARAPSRMAEQMMEDGEAQAGQGPGNNGRDPLGRPDRSQPARSRPVA